MSTFSFGAGPGNSGPSLMGTTGMRGGGGNQSQSQPYAYPTGTSSVGTAVMPATFSTHPFQYIQECLDPGSPNFRFRFFFYNPVPGGMLASPSLGKPAGVSDALWRQTLSDNPAPHRMIPVLANGFGDLVARRTWQDDHQTAQRTKLSELEGRLMALLGRQDLDVSTQLQVIQRQQLRLTLRTLGLMRRTEALRKAGVPLSGPEQTLMARIQAAGERLRSVPLGNVQLLEDRLRMALENGRLDPLSEIRAVGEQMTCDAEAMTALANVLEKQKDGLATLIDTINRDGKDLETMRNGFS